jgi:hypothetical protein
MGRSKNSKPLGTWDGRDERYLSLAQSPCRKIFDYFYRIYGCYFCQPNESCTFQPEKGERLPYHSSHGTAVLRDALLA